MKVLASILLSAITFVATAQTSTEVKQIGIRADNAEVKIDGKLMEWGHQLYTYNKACEIRYSIANSRDYLYLAIQATDVEIIQKLITGGLAFTINTNGKKDKNSLVITFPVYEKGKSHPYLNLEKPKEINGDKANYSMRLDSLISSGNSKITNAFKFIGISGLKNITDEMIPIYNVEGISAAAMLDNSLYYNFELSIPLKLIAGNSRPEKLLYNIRLNGLAFGGSDLKMVRDRFLVFKGSDGKDYMLGDATPRNWSLATPSDFWGEYTLAKF
nr:hypothetical protein [uncultured Mucilaginibacter sp.]